MPLVKAKICGITTIEAIHAVIEGGAEYVGFVFFHKSPRNVTPQKANELASELPKHIKTVAVLVDAENTEIENILKFFKPDYLQCHGSETTERIYDLRIKYNLPVIKAIPVRSSDDIARGKLHANTADMLLFDAKVPNAPLPGGNGLAFDWSLLKAREFSVNWFLSGGINIQNIADAVRTSGAKMVDISSSLESEPGIKDPHLIKEFLKAVKDI